MPYAALQGLIYIALVAPVGLAIWIGLCRWCARLSTSERLLLAAVLTPCVPLVEMLAIGFLPFERPLRTILPWVHAAVLVASLLAVFAGGRPVARAWPRVKSRARRCWLACDFATRSAVVVAAMVLSASFVFASWNAGDEHDGAMYRLVIVMQPFQDGRIARVTFSGSAYADAYPRTIELIASWTACVTERPHGLHLVNWYFLPTLGLSGCVMARRCGLSRSRAMLVGALAASTPLPVYLTGVLYNDLAVGSLTTAGVALALRSRERPWSTWDLAGCAIALGLGASEKVYAALFAGVIGLMLLGRAITARAGEPRAWRVLAVLAVAGVAASVQYLRSWYEFGSPLWPIKLELFGRVVFEGPLLTRDMFITAHGPWSQRWWTAVYKLFQSTSQDANGSFGLLFAIGVVPAVAFRLVRAARRTSSCFGNERFLLAAFVMPLCIPLCTNLRYSLVMLASGYTLAMLVITAWSRGRTDRRRGASAMLAILLMVNAFDWGRTIVKEVREQTRSGVAIWGPERNRRWYLQFMYLKPGVCPAMHQIVHRAMKPDERLVYATRCLPGLLYNDQFSYALEFRSIAYFVSPPPRVPTEQAILAGAAAWLSSLQRDGIDGVLVYARSHEDRVLSSSDSHFELAHEVSCDDRWATTRLYRRRPDGTSTAESPPR